jgi:hypothetical protein
MHRVATVCIHTRTFDMNLASTSGTFSDFVGMGVHRRHPLLQTASVVLCTSLATAADSRPVGKGGSHLRVPEKNFLVPLIG